jgi:Arc/MetJ family transcription regulator
VAKRPPKKARPRAFRIDAALLAEARRVLGTPNDTATIEAALDEAVFRRELRAGVDALGTMTFDPIDADDRA